MPDLPCARTGEEQISDGLKGSLKPVKAARQTIPAVIPAQAGMTEQKAV